MATIKDVAKKSGLSLATVSKYLNGGNVLEENEISIQKAIDELDYTVNEFGRALKAGHSKTIGVLIPELSGQFITEIITVVEDYLRNSGYAVMIADCRTSAKIEKEAVDFLVQKRVDGIINMPTDHTGSHLQSALNNNIPVVLVDRMLGSMDGKVSATLVDNISGAENAVTMLIEKGHRNIAIILGPPEHFTTHQRRLGYEIAFKKHNIPIKDEFIFYSDYTVESGHEITKEILENDSITSIFATNYEVTIGSIITLNERGILIPDDLSLVGFDNLELAKVVRPTLTIVTQPIADIGKETARIMLNLLKQNSKDRKHETITLKTGLSCGNSISENREPN